MGYLTTTLQQLRRASRRSKTLPRHRTSRRLFLETLEDRSLMAGIAPPPGLVSWWAAKNSAMDLAGDNDGTPLLGAAYAAGQVDQAFSFDGVNDRVEIGDHASLKLTASLTIEGWVRVDALPIAPKHGHILFRGDDRNGLDPYYLAVSSEGQFKFNIDSLTAKSQLVGGTVPLGQFVHVAATLDDATGAQRIYVNGVLAAETTTTVRPFGDLDPASNPGIAIGNHSGYPTSPHNYPFNGRIDELSVYNRALTAQEIQTIYDAGLTGDGKVAITISDASINEGANLSAFTSSNVAILEGSADIAFGPSRNADTVPDLYVVGRLSDNIVVYDGQTGSFIEELAGRSSGLDGPAWLLIGPNGDVFTKTIVSAGVTAILRVDHATKDVTTFLPAGDPGGKGMAFGPDGNFYIARSATDEVLRYDGTSGAFIDAFVPVGSGGLDSPGSVIFGRDRNDDSVPDLYVSSSISDQVLVYDGMTGTSLGIFVGAGSEGLDGPHDMEFGPDGNLYVVGSASSNERVYRFDGTTGAFIDIIVPPGSVAPETSFITFDSRGDLYISSENTHDVFRHRVGPLVTLSAPSATVVTVDFNTSAGSATPGTDYGAVSGRLTFAPGETSKRILISAVDDTVYEGNETFSVNLSNPVGGTIIDGNGIATILENDQPPTKFYVVNDATANQTYEYGASGAAIENYSLNSGNTAPRGAASTVAGDKTWVVDVNKKVYVYNTSGGLLGSWTAGSLASNATVEGVTTNGTDVWIVDARQDKVFRYTSAASRLSGSQNAASSFNLNSGNADPKDLVTDGTSIWVVNDSSTDKVFKYNASTGALLGSWTITSGGGSPTGITLDPSSPSHLWIVDSGTDRVYQYNTAVTRTSGSQSASTSFALAAGNSNPQGIADPPVFQAAAISDRPARNTSYDAALLDIVDEQSGFLAGRKRK